MAKNYFGVVLTTKEHDKYRLVVCSRWQVCNRILWLSESRKACVEGRIPAVAH